MCAFTIRNCSVIIVILFKLLCNMSILSLSHEIKFASFFVVSILFQPLYLLYAMPVLLSVLWDTLAMQVGNKLHRAKQVFKKEDWNGSIKHLGAGIARWRRKYICRLKRIAKILETYQIPLQWEKYSPKDKTYYN